MSGPPRRGACAPKPHLCIAKYPKLYKIRGSCELPRFLRRSDGSGRLRKKQWPPHWKPRFARIERLPPYVFTITAELKMAARRRGEDIIDFSMGNPDGPTPPHIVDKLIETVQRPDTHGYSVSKGIPRLRQAICNWYKRRYDVELDPETEAIVTIGSKEGIAHLALATLGRGDIVLVPNPSYPIHIYGPVIAGADIRQVPMTPDVDFFAELEHAIRMSYPEAEDADPQLPDQSDGAVRGAGVLRADRSRSRRSTTSTSCTTSPMPTSCFDG